MRAIKAKRLRRTAAAMTVGRPARQLLGMQHRRGTVQILNAAESTRGVYRALKSGRLQPESA